MTVTPPTAIDSRYGRTPSRRRRQRWLYIGGGVAVAIVVVAWVVWAGLDQAGATMDAEDVGNTIVNSHTVKVTYQVSMPPGQTAKCALQVQASDHSIVGWKIVDVPASKAFTNTYTQVVKSVGKPTTGLIYECWLT
ncbi:MAG: DUF4307 domain-containing protein [Actinomycetota bacterium]